MGTIRDAVVRVIAGGPGGRRTLRAGQSAILGIPLDALRVGKGPVGHVMNGHLLTVVLIVVAAPNR